MEEILKETQTDARMTADELFAAHELVKIMQKNNDKLQAQLETQ